MSYRASITTSQEEETASVDTHPPETAPSITWDKETAKYTYKNLEKFDLDQSSSTMTISRANHVRILDHILLTVMEGVQLMSRMYLPERRSLCMLLHTIHYRRSVVY